MKSRAWTRRVVSVLIACFFAIRSDLAFAASEKIESARNLQVDAKRAADVCAPLIVLISLADCPHCEVVRRAHLLPLLRQSSTTPIFIRQVELKGSGSLIGFSGEKMTHAEFSHLNKATIAPVVLFFGADGERIADPLVGAMIPEFYGAYFDTALANARMNARKTIATP